MCGITGIWHPDGAPVDPSVLGAMTRRLAHRGPDDEGLWRDGSIGFGHRRLSILDLSADGHQPMSDPSGRITITYNGEIYNYRDLRDEIVRESGYRFRTACDSEIIPAGYLLWGTELFARLEGMFAIALWDRDEQCLVLARDAVGIKPLFVSNTDGAVRFASELKAFEETPTSFALDPVQVHVMLANGFPSPERSLLRDVDQIPPGSFRVIRRDGSSETCFWSPRRRPSITDMDEAVGTIGPLLSEVVGDMLQSDVPVGILQSGGIDSSLIAVSTPDRDVPLFTARFQEGDFDETGAAALVAGHLGNPHHVVPVTTIADPVATFRSMALAYDGQLADSSGFAFYELCRAVSRHVTVALSGEGGDEFFAGYPTYRASRLSAQLAPLLPSGAWEGLGRLALLAARRDQNRLPVLEKAARFFLGNAAAPHCPHPQWRCQIFERDRKRLYGRGLADVGDLDPFADYEGRITRASDRFAGTQRTDHNLYGDQTYYLPGDLLTKADRISMAHGLEIRVPFLDTRIMDFAGSLDLSLLTPFKGPDKKVLRQMLDQSGLPREIVRHPKRGFMVPVAQMLREHLRPLSLQMFEKQPEVFEPWLDAGSVRMLWREHDERRANHKYPLWLLLTLGVWLETHV